MRERHQSGALRMKETESMKETEKTGNGRRSKFRFAIHRELRYKVLEDDTVVESGVGQTIDMGSGGVAFYIDHELKTGSYIQLAISWPAMLGESCPMRLVVFGRVLRSTGRRSACTVEKYEFRTQARATVTPIPPVRHDFMLQRWAVAARKETLKAASA